MVGWTTGKEVLDESALAEESQRGSVDEVGGWVVFREQLDPPMLVLMSGFVLYLQWEGGARCLYLCLY